MSIVYALCLQWSRTGSHLIHLICEKNYSSHFLFPDRECDVHRSTCLFYVHTLET